ncbi:NlpC/P60 family protein [Roseococcus pinisoli]|uniref:C40 family peptidase n=1 Tax=Roseococcus pinisoli TaxID=2835040 RepID=A0ABS5QIH5_9PROT|nr:NlpC/P60 family protein [Roseococcus pinisoli]MBS7812343.1 C40 family peptidase [Roseococcus pinisoli]
MASSFVRPQPFGAAVEAAIQKHAVEMHPQEACGVVTAQGYVRCANVADDPLKNFAISEEELALHRPIFAIVHSHPGGSLTPSELDQQRQIDGDLIWGICAVHHDPVDGLTPLPVLWWGDGVWQDHDLPPLIARPFRWGPTGTDGAGDCFSLARDYYQLHHGFLMDEVARASGFWRRGADPYGTRWKSAGFEKIELTDMQPGDAVFLCIRADVPNHAAIFLGEGGLILHHLENHLSYREPLARWTNSVRLALRPPRPRLEGAPAIA